MTFIMVNVSMVRLAPGPLRWRQASYSRSGCTQFRPETCGFDTCLVTCCICIHVKQVFVRNWIPCFGPSRGFSCPPWRPPRTISTDSPDFEFSYRNLMPSIDGQRFFLDKRQFFPQEFQVRGSNQDIYGQPMVSLWSALCHIHAWSIDKWSDPGLEDAMAPLISMVLSAFVWFRSPRTMAGGCKY
jgi:hypothetical protein